MNNSVRFAPIIPPAPSRFSGIRTRIITALIAGSIALCATLYSPYSFGALLLILLPMMAREWEGLNLHTSWRFRLWGIIYITPAIFALGWLRIHPFSNGDEYQVSAAWILGLFCLIWTTDIAAYITGKMIGGPKLAPRFSPNKTIAGLVGAVAATALVALYLVQFTPYIPAIFAAIAGALIAILGQAGDILESWLKRRCGVKDSGRLLPGHGGLLDRVDGLIAVAPLYALAVYFGSPT